MNILSQFDKKILKTLGKPCKLWRKEIEKERIGNDMGKVLPELLSSPLVKRYQRGEPILSKGVALLIKEIRCVSRLASRELGQTFLGGDTLQKKNPWNGFHGFFFWFFY